jgi:hypothetical protein
MTRNAVSHGIAAFNLAVEVSASSQLVRVAAFFGEFDNWNM